MPWGTYAVSPADAEPVDQQVAPLLEVPREGQGELLLVVERQGHRRLQRRPRGEGEPLLGGQDRAHELGRAGRPADLPPGERVRLAGARQGQRPLRHPGQGRDRHVLGAVEGQVLVDLVGDHDEVVLDRHVGHRLQLLPAEHRPGRVVRAVEQHEPGARRHRGPQRVDVEPEVGRPQRHRPAYAARHLDHRDVRVVVGLQHDHLVARVDQPEQRRCDPLGAAGGHHHLAVRVELEAVVALLVPRDRLPQLGSAGPRCVLVGAVLQGPHRRRDHLRRPVLVGEPLPEVDRPRPHRQRRHLGEDRRGDALQPGRESHHETQTYGDPPVQNGRVSARTHGDPPVQNRRVSA